MSMQTSAVMNDGGSADGGPDLRRILALLEDLGPSCEPTAVFAAVTRLCVPLLCDAATATLTHAEQTHRLQWPPQLSDAGPQSRESALPSSQRIGLRSIATPITGISDDPAAGYRGVLTLEFYDSRPGPSHGVLAQLVVDRAVALIERQRLAAVVLTHQSQVEHLRIALSTNRQIGTALGILMAGYKLTDDQAFDLLRRVSQQRHRKIHDLALDVIDTGMIELPAGITVHPLTTPSETAEAATEHRARPRPQTPCTPRTPR
jgi:ANTAR domain